MVKRRRKKNQTARVSPSPEVVVREIEPPPTYEPPEVSDTLSDEDRARLLSGPPQPVVKPDISHLRDALSGGWPTFKQGDTVVIERYAWMLKGRPYLDTRVFTVRSVDLATGFVELYDPVRGQHATDNWRHGIKIGQVYKYADDGGSFLLTTKKKRGRPRKNFGPPASDAPPPPPPGEKKKRGRPKGSKNRPKDVIAAEKREKFARAKK